MKTNVFSFSKGTHIHIHSVANYNAKSVKSLMDDPLSRRCVTNNYLQPKPVNVIFTVVQSLL